MEIFSRIALFGALLFVMTGCAKDPAKVQEAKSMAVCDCESAECATEALSRFKSNEESVKGIAMTDAQRERAQIAQERLAQCLNKLGVQQ